MSLTAKIRFLVMNRTNEVIAPRDENLPGFDPGALKAAGEIPKKYSPSFRNLAMARKFAEALAAKYTGEAFYVSQVLGGAKVVAPTTWANAVAGELHDESLAEGNDDDDANE